MVNGEGMGWLHWGKRGRGPLTHLGHKGILEREGRTGADADYKKVGVETGGSQLPQGENDECHRMFSGHHCKAKGPYLQFCE